jgi:Xaa-Pro aminopeptidase
MSAPKTELQIKQDRLAEFLDRHRLDGVLLGRRNNFAWITGGRDNRIANFSPAGVAYILAGRDGSRVCLTNTIEAPRFRTEELTGTDIEVIEWPWYDPSAAQRVLKDAIAGRRIAADVSDVGEFNHFGAGFSRLPDDFVELRWSLTDAEIDRYRDGARRTSIAMEAACRQLMHGMNEHEASGILDHEMHKQGLNPVVNLIASDDRIARYRHPIAVNKPVERYVMLVICSEFAGLITSMTRFVSFVPLSDELKRKQQAVVNVDAAVNFSTRPGMTLGEMFKVIQKAYADQGFADQWKLHHQGGSAGYNGREAFAEPGSPVTVRENQAFAWNPSITGVKSEDTILVRNSGIDFLTTISNDWPALTATFNGRGIKRADILVK